MNQPSALIFLGTIFIGFAPIFVKLIHLSPTLIGVYRCGLGALFFGSLWLFAKHPRPSAPVGKLILVAGVIFAADLFVWHRSVVYVGAGVGTLLGNTQVFYISLFAIVFLKERLTLRFSISVLLAFIGVILLSSPDNVQDSPLYLRGLIFGLTTGVLYALYVLAMRRLAGLAPGSSIFILTGVSAVTTVLLLITAALEKDVALPTASDWIWTIGLAFFSQFLGWLCIMTQLSKVPASRAGLILLMQNVVAFILGAIVFGESLSRRQWAGVALVLLGIYGGQRGRIPSAFETGPKSR